MRKGELNVEVNREGDPGYSGLPGVREADPGGPEMLPGVRGCVSAAPGVVRSHESFLRRKGRPWDSGLQERRHALPASSSQARCRTGRASPLPHIGTAGCNQRPQMPGVVPRGLGMGGACSRDRSQTKTSPPFLCRKDKGAPKYDPLVKRLRHRPFTAVTRVRLPHGSPEAW